MELSTCKAEMMRLLVNWPHRAPSAADIAALVAVYHEALSDLTDAEMADACREAVRSCRHFPVPAELRAIVRPPTDLGEDAGPTTADLIRMQQRHRELAGVPLLPERASGATTREERSARTQRFLDQHRELLDRMLVAGGWRNTPVSLPERRRRIREYPNRQAAEEMAARAAERLAEQRPGGTES